MAEPDPKAFSFITNLFKFLESAPFSLQSVLDNLTKEIGADRGILVTCSETTNQIRVLAGSNLKDPNLTLEEFQISRTVFREVIRFRQTVLIRNPPGRTGLQRTKQYRRTTSTLYSGRSHYGP